MSGNLKLRKLPEKIPDPIPDPTDPWSDDSLGRKSCGVFLSKVVSDASEPMTLFVNGEWGSGKSFFLDRWTLQLKAEGFSTIAFNVWQDDGLTDPLIALFGQLQSNLHCKPGYVRSVKGIVQKVGEILSAGLEEVSCACSNKTGIDAVRFMRNAGSQLAQRIEQYGKLIEARTLLRDRLFGLAEKVYADTGKPLVFLVDELDRCRPTFAIEVLERIKHYFNIPHIVFVIGADLVQMGHTVRAVYGNIDVANYLRRFVDFEFKLPEPDRAAYFTLLWNKYDMKYAFADSKGRSSLQQALFGARMILLELSVMHQFTLREIDATFRLLMMIARHSWKNESVPSELVAALAVLKLVAPKVCFEWLRGTLSVCDVVNALIPMEKVENFVRLKDLLAAIYSTYYDEKSVAARNANVFLRVCSDREIDGIEFKNELPLCMRKMRNQDFKDILELVKKFRNRPGEEYSFKSLLAIGARFDLLMGEMSSYKGMRNDVTRIARHEVDSRDGDVGREMFGGGNGSFSVVIQRRG